MIQIILMGGLFFTFWIPRDFVFMSVGFDIVSTKLKRFIFRFRPRVKNLYNSIEFSRKKRIPVKHLNWNRNSIKMPSHRHSNFSSVYSSHFYFIFKSFYHRSYTVTYRRWMSGFFGRGGWREASWPYRYFFDIPPVNSQQLKL